MQLETFKKRYQTLQASLEADFSKNPDTVEALVQKRSDEVDALLCDIWQAFGINDALCLVAVGGYGRCELHLHSDIDLLILIPEQSHQTHQQSLSKFLTFLWDVGLEVGHSTRDIEDCKTQINDLSVVTNLLESRVIIGMQPLFTKMKLMIKASDWSSQSFFVEKQKEQHERHLRYSNTAYNLEPNLKESAGGLRDIQTIAWVAKWYLDANTLMDLVKKSYLTQGEYDLLRSSQVFLWKVRFALHIIAKRREDRIAFQYQQPVAKLLNYEAAGVEQLMRDYYQTATKVSRLNDILLQLFEQSVVYVQNLNARFVISHGYICMTNNDIFKQHPSAFIEIFLLVAKHNYVSGISADTLRQMQHDIDLIDENYYKKRANNRLFIELLQQKQGVNKALKLMNRYGVLEHYIPAFGKITGLMQYDLFHAYTVDQHTLFVIRNLRRFFINDFSKEFELCSEIAQTMKKSELLFLAGLFHDIAKGRGGNHAKLGAKDVREFLQHHQFKTDDIALVSGLVEQHLLMSQTAQKQDIEDLDVINAFAEKVKSVEFLEFLYLLTVADIRATREDLWNGWKDSLLKTLFFKTKKQLQNYSKPSSVSKQVEEIKQVLEREIKQQGYNVKNTKDILDTLPKDYFLRYRIEDILWHLHLLSKQTEQNNKAVRVATRLSEYSVVDIFVYGDNSKGLFFRLINIIEKLNLNIVDAKILTSKDDKAYNTISVLQNKAFETSNINQIIEQQLVKNEIDVRAISDKYVSRHFECKAKIVFSHSDKWNLTKIEIGMIDKQGLLSNIAHIFYQLDIYLINARISTMGERVEDVFFISNVDKQPLNKQEQTQLKHYLEEKL